MSYQCTRCSFKHGDRGKTREHLRKEHTFRKEDGPLSDFMRRV